MKLNLSNTAHNILEIFGITVERANELQDELEELVDGTVSQSTEFTITDLITKAQAITSGEEELAFTFVCIGRYLVQAEAQQMEVDQRIDSILDRFSQHALFNQSSNTAPSN